MLEFLVHLILTAGLLLLIGSLLLSALNISIASLIGPA